LMLQGVLTAAMAIFAATTMAPGAVSGAARARIMASTAEDYELARWLDKSLPLDPVIVAQTRAHALLPRPFVSFGAMRYQPRSASAPPLLNQFKAAGVNVIVVNVDVDNRPFAPLAGTLGKVVAGPVKLPSPARNPRNRGSDRTWAAFQFLPPAP